MLKKIQTTDYTIEFSSLVDSTFERFITENYSKSKKIILVDTNTHEHCLDYLITNFECLKTAEIILLPSGEENKILEVCSQVWEALSEYQITRKDLIINLGGGLVTDMGGFIASIYKRGIDFINIPTSLLAMVDASVGGKTGIDLNRFKNQLGVFSNPKSLFIDPSFLNTLPEIERLNGFAEMLKHGLIAKKSHWDQLKNCEISDIHAELIHDSVSIKNEIVALDPFEKNVRKKLNFGHTFGHAIEGFFLHSKNKIAHGHAIALGMICETYLSYEKEFISELQFNEIIQVLSSKFSVLGLKESDYEELFTLMKQDKKNQNSKVLCVLLTGIGESIIDVELSFEKATLCFNYLNSLREVKSNN